MKIFETIKVTTPTNSVRYLPNVAKIGGVLVGVTFVNKRKDGSWNMKYKPYFNSTMLTPEKKSEIQSIQTWTPELIEKYNQFMFKLGENPGGYTVEEYKKQYRNYAGLTQTCWECGREFTYSQCKRDGGDWKESYCGC